MGNIEKEMKPSAKIESRRAKRQKRQRAQIAEKNVRVALRRPNAGDEAEEIFRGCTFLKQQYLPGLSSGSTRKSVQHRLLLIRFCRIRCRARVAYVANGSLKPLVFQDKDKSTRRRNSLSLPRYQGQVSTAQVTTGYENNFRLSLAILRKHCYGKTRLFQNEKKKKNGKKTWKYVNSYT